MAEPYGEDEIRALLAEAHDVGPMPQEVADRLDSVIVDLRGEASRSVVPLRRRAPRWLPAAAAAAIVLSVGSVAGLNALHQRGGADSRATSSTADESSASPSATTPDTPLLRSPQGAEASRPPAPATADQEGARARRTPPSLSSADFATQAAALSPLITERDTIRVSSGPEACLPLADFMTTTRALEITLDGRRAALVVLPEGGAVTLKAVACGTGRELESSTLPGTATP